MFRRSLSRARKHRKTFRDPDIKGRLVRGRFRRLAVEALEARHLLATFTVTNLGDAPVIASGNAPGTLRQAIFDANASGGADSIAFAAGLHGTITLTAGELLITEALSIDGPGAHLIAVDASGNDPTPSDSNGDGSRVFHINDSQIAANNPVTIGGLTITGGDASSGGGGIRSLENLTLVDSIVTGNSTTDDGAGVFVSTLSGLNSIARSTISGNVALTTGDLGGGMYAYVGGGGIAISDSTISANRAYFGGGIFARAVTGSVTITNSTISGNAAGQAGGGIFIRTGSGTSTIAHSTISNNTSNADLGVIGTGGGIYAEGTGTLALRHTIVSGNFDIHPTLAAPDIDATYASNVPTLSVSYSLIGNNSRSTLAEAQAPDANGNLIGDPSGGGVIDARLAPLANNGGPTQTHALIIGSPAIDAGDPLAVAGVGGTPAFDQRGNPFSRVREGDVFGAPRIDIGAFEAALVLLPDPFEPNDSIAAATILGSETEITLRELTIHNEADEDFFKITAHDTGKLIVRAYFDQAIGDLDMQIVDRFGNEIASSTSTDSDEAIIIPVVEQEMYFVRVYGFAGATNEYSLEIENFDAPVPSAIHLDPTSDLGRLRNDNITSDITPTFVIQADVLNFVDPNDDGVFDVAALTAAQATNRDPGIAVQVRIVSSNDPSFVPVLAFAEPLSPLSPTLYRVTLPDPLPDGVYFASASTRIFDGQRNGAGEVDPATGRSDLSDPLWFTIDTTKPNVFFGESTVANDGLDPSSDTGVASQPTTIVDRITGDSSPALFGTAEANSTVRVFVRNALGARVLVGETVATPFSGNNPLATGRWTLTSTIDMNDPLLGFTSLDGVRHFEVEAEDIAGNVSPGALFQLFDVPQPIVDNATSEFTIEVAGLAGPITDLDISLDISHTHDADLEVFLISPAGTTVQLFADVGGDGDDFVDTTLDDEATTAIELGLAPFTGDFIPMELLEAFDGEDPNGTWTLRIIDDLPGDDGSLDSWSLCFQSSLDIFVDTQGPRVTKVTIDDYDLTNPKAGPTPTINELTISFSDLPARTAEFLYPAVNQVQATTPGNYVLVGDRVGIVPIVNVVYADTSVAGASATTDVTLILAGPLTDDHYTLTVRDNLRDDADNRLDGEYFGEPTAFPTGDGVPGGDFAFQFTVDGLPELGVWAAGTVLIDANGNFVSNPIGPWGDLAFHLGYSSDNVFAGNFSAIGDQADGFDKLAAYGRVGDQYRWLIDINNDGVVDLNIPENAINGIPVAGNFDGNDDNGDEVGIFTGSAWHLDTNHDFHVDSMYAALYGGFPIVGDFDGDGDDDLGTYVATQDGGNRFVFDLNAPAPGGRLHVDGIADYAFQVGVPALGSGFTGFPGVRERPFAADMNGDGVDDIGLWVPDGTALVPGDMGEWFIFLSGDLPYTAGVETTLVDRIDNGLIQFSPRPFAYDYYAAFGNSFALPVVGNFDPPGLSASTTAASAKSQQTPTQAPLVQAPETPIRTIHPPAAIDTKELVGASSIEIAPASKIPSEAAVESKSPSLSVKTTAETTPKSDPRAVPNSKTPGTIISSGDATEKQPLHTPVQLIVSNSESPATSDKATKAIVTASPKIGAAIAATEAIAPKDGALQKPAPTKPAVAKLEPSEPPAVKGAMPIDATDKKSKLVANEVNPRVSVVASPPSSSKSLVEPSLSADSQSARSVLIVEMPAAAPAEVAVAYRSSYRAIETEEIACGGPFPMAVASRSETAPSQAAQQHTATKAPVDAALAIAPTEAPRPEARTMAIVARSTISGESSAKTRDVSNTQDDRGATIARSSTRTSEHRMVESIARHEPARPSPAHLRPDSPLAARSIITATIDHPAPSATTASTSSTATTHAGISPQAIDKALSQLLSTLDLAANGAGKGESECRLASRYDTDADASDQRIAQESIWTDLKW